MSTREPLNEVEREERRMRFDEAAEEYQRARPGYPDKVFDDIEALGGIADHARVLEIGCGTGQATRSLAERGHEVVGVELGKSLADVARRELASYPNVAIHAGAFEAWPLPDERFDLVLAATSFHWIDPEIRLAKSAAALKDGGGIGIVVISTRRETGLDGGFFATERQCFERNGYEMWGERDISEDAQTLDSSELFTEPIVRNHQFTIEYTEAEYIEFLRTQSAIRNNLGEADRENLLNQISEAIKNEYSGRVLRPCTAELAFARKC